MQETTLLQFIKALSSKAPVPGGGGASALAGAIGTALASMVGNLTSGKKKYAEYQPDIERILEEAERLTTKLLQLIEEDAAVFEPLSKAYGLPKGTPEELAHKEEVMEGALYEASLVPLRIMETAVEAIRLQEELSVKGSVLAISDVGVGAKLLEAALQGASLNVYINTKLMKNREQAEELNQRAEALIQEGAERSQQVFEVVKSRLLGTDVKRK
ncbi:MAG: cyclodeaminase/cyclohydrolase family protein [Lachnospiraceae bacterium]|jgi:formiminotetrahydrofolate cyclodeaminase|nr:cyclodeaminase/cyclohydrolase family protein [Lachnospiraceae bacterium]